jgi:hypothetical protein
MSVSTTSNRVDYIGNGTVSTYTFSFPTVASTDIVVQVADTSTPPNVSPLTLGTDFNVEDAGNPNGGSIELISSGQSWLTGGNLKNGYTLTILRIRPLTQATDIRNQGTYYPESLEDEFDDIVLILQQIQEQISRCVGFPVLIKPSAFSPILPDGPYVAGSLIVVNEDANGFALQGPNVTGIYGVPAQEIPSGAINGTNVDFVLEYNPISAGSVSIFIDKAIQFQTGESPDYTIAGNTVTMAVAPQPGQTIYAVYQH